MNDKKKKLKILFLSHKVPYPPNQGDRIPTFYRVKSLSRNHQIALVYPCFYKKELAHKEVLRKYCESIDTVYINSFLAKIKGLFFILIGKTATLPYFYSRVLHKKIKETIRREKPDIIYVYSSSMGQYVADVRSIKKIMDFADADSHKWTQYAEKVRFPLSQLYRAEGKRMREYEKFLSGKFDCTIAISENEKKFFETYLKKPKMYVVPNGVNLDYFSPSHTKYDAKKIIFVGAMDYYANVDAVVYFYQNIFPIIKKQIPEIKFYIVGNRPVKEIRKLGKDPNVVVTGFVEDIRPYLANASVCVVPLRMARGVQNKILEAMACRIPVVTTSKGNEGINAKRGKEIIVNDDPEEFAESVIKLNLKEEYRDDIAGNGRQFVEKNFSWQKSMDDLESIVTRESNKE